jgi:tetratricopeptide (TPR) repeat protein
VPEKQERIDLLKRFLMEYTPSHGREENEGKLKNRIRILNELGIAHRSRSEYPAAKYYLEQALDLGKDNEELIYLKANTLHELGISYANQGEVAKALAILSRISGTSGKDWQSSRESCYFPQSSNNLCQSRGSSQGDRTL